MDNLEESYSWADRLATHFAQTYRSGHIFNFVLGGFAVCLGLAAFMAPHLKFEEAALRAADYLRDHPQRAASAPASNGIAAGSTIASSPSGCARCAASSFSGSPRPIRRAQRPIPCPSAGSTGMPAASGARWAAHRDHRPACAARLGKAIAEHEVEPQVGYHERNATQIEMLDKRLEQTGMVLFVATLLVSVATLVGLGFGSAFVNKYGNWFTLVSAGFPALGTAVFGIRFQADFGGDALRSMATADTLRQIDGELRKNVSFPAPPTSPSRRRGSCSPTSTSGGSSTSSATCRSASASRSWRWRRPRCVDRKRRVGISGKVRCPVFARHVLEHMVHRAGPAPDCAFGCEL